jgi:predicted membrane protein
MILIIIGTAKVIKREYFTAAILYSIGFFFLMPRIIKAYPAYFPNFDGGFTHTFWPVLLIISGILLILSKLYGTPRGGCNTSFKNCTDNQKHSNYSKTTGSFEKNAVFGGGEHIVLEPNFTGGEVNAIFGGLTLDLRHSTLAPGVSHLEVNAVFGGVTIIVPRDWYVETQMDAVFGGFEDKRLVKDSINLERKLIIKGACVFGGGELRD